MTTPVVYARQQLLRARQAAQEVVRRLYVRGYVVTLAQSADSGDQHAASALAILLHEAGDLDAPGSPHGYRYAADALAELASARGLPVQPRAVSLSMFQRPWRRAAPIRVSVSQAGR